MSPCHYVTSSYTLIENGDAKIQVISQPRIPPNHYELNAAAFSYFLKRCWLL